MPDRNYPNGAFLYLSAITRALDPGKGRWEVNKSGAKLGFRRGIKRCGKIVMYVMFAFKKVFEQTSAHRPELYFQSLSGCRIQREDGSYTCSYIGLCVRLP